MTVIGDFYIENGRKGDFIVETNKFFYKVAIFSLFRF